MENTIAKVSAETDVITPAQLLKHWQNHRNLTRRVIEAFPEKNYTIIPSEACVPLPSWHGNIGDGCSWHEGRCEGQLGKRSGCVRKTSPAH